MKMKREHRVPLCGRAIEILAAARTLRGGDRVVFTARSGQPPQQESAPVAPGARGRGRSPWLPILVPGLGAAEETDHPREVIEAALAHVVGNKVEAAYARSDLFERRRCLMDDTAELAFCRPGRYSYVTPAGSVAPHRRSPSGKGILSPFARHSIVFTAGTVRSLRVRPSGPPRGLRGSVSPAIRSLRTALPS